MCTLGASSGFKRSASRYSAIAPSKSPFLPSASPRLWCAQPYWGSSAAPHDIPQSHRPVALLAERVGRGRRAPSHCSGSGATPRGIPQSPRPVALVLRVRRRGCSALRIIRVQAQASRYSAIAPSRSPLSFERDRRGVMSPLHHSGSSAAPRDIPRWHRPSRPSCQARLRGSGAPLQDSGFKRSASRYSAMAPSKSPLSSSARAELQ